MPPVYYIFIKQNYFQAMSQRSKIKLKIKVKTYINIILVFMIVKTKRKVWGWYAPLFLGEPNITL